MATYATVVAFDISVFLSAVMILCTLVLAMLSKSVARSPSWYNLVTAWLVYSLSYGLLVGRQESSDQPPIGLCVTQTVLIYAVPVLVASAMCNFYIELYLILSELRSGYSSHSKWWRSFWLVITPWLIFIVIIVGVLLLIFLGNRFYLVRRASTNYYCHLEDALPCTVTGGVLVAIVGIMLPLQAWLAFNIYRSQDALRRLAEADRQPFITLYVRLTLVTLSTILGFGLSMTAVFSTGSDKTSLAYPILAVIMAIALGTEKDILRVWLFWRPSRLCSSTIFKVSTTHETGLEEGARQNTRFRPGSLCTGNPNFKVDRGFSTRPGLEM